MSGPAGTGKTTAVPTVAPECDQKGRLAAFFFWRKTGDCGGINKLAATYQIAGKISLAKEGIEAGSLLINISTINVNPAAPDLVVFGGLDECSSREGICEWIRKNELPFRFLLTSRPEPEIKTCFTYAPSIRALSLSYRADVFVEQLEKAWPMQRRVEEHGASEWPSRSDLNRLVEKSEGLFLCAATTVRYMGDSEGYPSKRVPHPIGYCLSQTLLHLRSAPYVPSLNAWKRGPRLCKVHKSVQGSQITKWSFEVCGSRH